MGEERIKSAFEIAMERISDLPRLTPEEIAAQKEKEYGPIGESLCNRYLDGSIPENHLPVELGRHDGEQGAIARRALIRCLCRSIRLENAPMAIRALTGLRLFAGDKKGLLEEAATELSRMLGEFEREMEERSHEFEALAREELHKLGISGSAVRPNLNQNEPWKQEGILILKKLEPGLVDLRERVLRALGA